MPLLGGKFYMNPAYGRALERAREAEDVLQRNKLADARWVTISGRHVLIQEDAQTPARRNPKRFNGDATYYNLPGKRTASGAAFDPNKMAAAMTAEKAKLGQTVTVTYTHKDDRGNMVTKSVSVVVNDRGPFARDAHGKTKAPLQPDPNGVIDLTPAAFRQLVGTTKPGRVFVTVAAPNE